VTWKKTAGARLAISNEKKKMEGPDTANTEIGRVGRQKGGVSWGKFRDSKDFRSAQAEASPAGE